MYCHKCGTKVADDAARFCSNCGGELPIEQTPEPFTEGKMDGQIEDTIENRTLENSTQEKQSRELKQKAGSSKLFWPVAVPVLSLILAGGAGYAYYYEQVHMNQEVVSLKGKAETAALKGNYTEALTSLKKAKNLRPSYKVLDEDKAIINQAITLDKSLKTISNSLKTQQIEKADSQIASFKDLLQKLKGPLFTPFQKQIAGKSTTLAVAKIKIEINSLNSVEALAAKLTTLSSLQSAETDEVKRLILSKIVDVTTKDAEKQLNEKQFTNAITTVEKGLEYADTDSKLLSFKDRIKTEQTAFEKAEQQRIEQAMEVAAQEDLMNHTSAVSVENLTATTDEYGDVQITGDIKNTATVPISSIKLYYTVYDLSGNTIGTDYIYVNPYYLDPGENGSFEATYFGANQDTNVTVTSATWQLN